MAKPEKERGSVLSTAQRHTAFLDDPRVTAALSRSDFTLSDLKNRPMTVYIVLPRRAIATNNRLLRGFIGLALAAITASHSRPELPVAFFLDEFAQLGRMAAVEDAIAIVRGYGAAFWIFVQDLSQLRAVYPKWQTFLANATQQFFGVADYDTAKYVSDKLGQETVQYQTVSRAKEASTSEHFTGRALATPDEILATPFVITFLAGERPYYLAPLNYLRDPEYAGLADPNPYHA
jgi:type IV secretory pathway TraG/TraD family ATPase VirD4